MSDENEAGRRWVVEPPVASGEISLYMAAGDGTELNEEQQAALSALLRSLEASDAEVVGLTSPRCPSDSSTCKGLQCGKVSCGALACELTRGLAASASSSSWTLMGSFPQILA